MQRTFFVATYTPDKSLKLEEVHLALWFDVASGHVYRIYKHYEPLDVTHCLNFSIYKGIADLLYSLQHIMGYLE